MAKDSLSPIGARALQPERSMATPLARLRVVVARMGDGIGAPATSLIGALSQAGAIVTDFPLMHVERVASDALTAALVSWSDFAWIVAADDDAVDALVDALARSGRRLNTQRVALVGAAASARADELGLPTAVATESHATAALIDALAVRDDVEGARALVLCAQEASEPLRVGLEALGAHATVVSMSWKAPETGLSERLLALVVSHGVDILVLTSTAAVDVLQDAIPAELTRRFPLACIGAHTARAARMAGFPVRIEQEYLSPASMVKALAALVPSGA